MKQNAKKKCAIGETECNETVFRIDQRRKKGWGSGRRERIEMERKETKRNGVKNLKMS